MMEIREKNGKRIEVTWGDDPNVIYLYKKFKLLDEMTIKEILDTLSASSISFDKPDDFLKANTWYKV